MMYSARRSTLVRVTALTIVLIVLLSSFVIAAAQQSTNEVFQRVWDRTDQPVEAGVVSRTWMWGDQVTDLLTEEYADAPGSKRTVQYFDKSRMEESGADGLWSVTNGLLALELITGQMQMGHDTFIQRVPALINVAGDPDDTTGPTYASFRHQAGQTVEDRVDALVTQRIDRLGNVTEDSTLAEQDVRVATYDTVTGHNIAMPFYEFMHSRGTVLEDGVYIEGPLVEHPVYATGLPVTEPYWTEVKVDGTRQLVLAQCFERRCLTYTPGNEPGWQVEAGNVGQHYHAWRYAQSDAEGQLLFVGNIWSEDGELTYSNIFLVNADGSNLVNVTGNLPGEVHGLAWSPDGSKVAFGRGPQWDSHIVVMDADGSNLTQLTNDGFSYDPAWSPDGTQIAFRRQINDDEIQIFVMNADGSDQRQVTSIAPIGGGSSISHSPVWSPDGTTIAFSNISDTTGISPHPSTVYVVNVDGTNLTPLVDAVGDATPLWSPDGTKIAYRHERVGGRDSVGTRLFVMDADGSNVVEIRLDRNYHGSNDHTSPDWSPNSSRLVYAQMLGIFTTDPDGTNQVQIAAFGVHPKWSPDGKHIAFSTYEGLMVVAADGSTVPAVIADEPVWWELSWRP